VRTHFFTLLLIALFFAAFGIITTLTPRLALAQSDTTVAPTATATATLIAPLPTEGSVLREYWVNTPGNSPDDLRLNPNYPANPDFCDFGTEISTTPNLAGNFGARVRGYLTPPETGEYIFWIGSDNASEFWLSPSGNQNDVRKILDFDAFSDYLDFDVSIQQESYPLQLEAGQRHYFEAILKEDDSNFNWLAVAWLGPGIDVREVIGARYLSSAGLACSIDPVATPSP
jgi:hypothetical protein